MSSTGDGSRNTDLGAAGVSGTLVRLLGVGFLAFGMQTMIWGFHNAYWEVDGFLAGVKGRMEVVKVGYDVLMGLAVVTAGALTAFVGLSAAGGRRASCVMLKYLLCMNVALVVLDVACSVLLGPDLWGDPPHVYPFVTTVSPTLQIPFVLAYPFAGYFNYIVWLRANPWLATRLGAVGFFVLNAVAFGGLILAEQRPARSGPGGRTALGAAVLAIAVAVLGFGVWKMTSGAAQVRLLLWMCVVPLTVAFLLLQAAPTTGMRGMASLLLAGCILPSAWMLFGCRLHLPGLAGLAGGMLFGLIGCLMAPGLVRSATASPAQKGRAVGFAIATSVCGLLMAAAWGGTAYYGDVGSFVFTFYALLLFLPLAAGGLMRGGADTPVCPPAQSTLRGRKACPTGP